MPVLQAILAGVKVVAILPRARIDPSKTSSSTCVVQVSIPGGYAKDAPVGLSLIGPAGSDEDLLEVVKQLHPLFK